MNFVRVPYETVERGRIRREKAAARKARQRLAGRENDKRRSHHEDRRFVGWDGEGPRDAGYALFGNSDGNELCRPNIPTRDILSMLVDHKQANPDTIDVWFGGDYDVSMLLWELPRRNMSALHEFGKTTWNEFRIEHIPHKWFKVRCGGITVTVFDIHSFFDSGYYDALVDWNVGTEEERAHIKTGKAGRADFVWVDIAEIRDYFRLELRLMPILCERLREVFADAGYVPRSWHGPGALARMALRRHDVYAAMGTVPSEVAWAARCAFAGGRFELRWAGHFKGKIWNYDIHSAYPYFATMLPNLAKGSWRTTDHFERGKFAVYHIEYEASDPDPFKLYPLFKRLGNAGVVWPYRVTGWYWAPEAELVANDTDARIIGGWVFDEEDETDKPFLWLQEYYHRRRLLKKNGQAAEYTFKLIINAVYGQLAQRVGWDRKNGKPPRTHQLEWAGFITSACRAAVYRAACSVGEKIISIDTDGVYSLAPIDNLDIGDNLGQWECTEYDDGVFWQSGVYALARDGEWIKGRARGIPKGTYTADDLLARIQTREPLAIKKNKFMGYRQADNGQWDRRNTWIEDRPALVFGGTGKRSHIGRNGKCNSNCHNDVHALGAIQFVYGPEGDPDSKPHYLPWLENDPEMEEAKKLGYFVYSEEDPDSEVEGWLKSAASEKSPNTLQSLRLARNGNNASAAGIGTRTRARLGSLFSRRTK